MKWGWQHFPPHEVLSPDGLSMYARGHLMVQGFALSALEEIRAEVGPLAVNKRGRRLRGYRSVEENQTLPNFTHYSRHVQGIAFDVTPTNVSLAFFLEWLERNFRSFGVGAIGFYPYSNFIHIDFRPLTSPEPTTWTQKPLH